MSDFKLLLFVFTLLFSMNLLSEDSLNSYNRQEINALKLSISQGKIILSVPSEVADSICMLKYVAKAISLEMGMDIELKLIPSKRLIKLVNNSLIHGSFVRTEEHQRLIPNTFKITKPIIQLPFHAFALSKM